MFCVSCLYTMRNSITIFIVIIVIGLAVGGYTLFKDGDSDLSLGNISEVTPTPLTSNEVQEEELSEVVIVLMETSKGNITLGLIPMIAPKTVANFLKLTEQGFYDGTKFHRVLEDFIIQGGDPLSKDDNPANDGTGGPGYKFEDEINPRKQGLDDETIAKLEAAGFKYNFELESLPVIPGVIAMANSGANTNGSQFFIVTTQPQPHLNGRHTVFGGVLDGMDVVLSIKQGDVIKKVTIQELETNN